MTTPTTAYDIKKLAHALNRGELDDVLPVLKDWIRMREDRIKEKSS